MTQLITSAAELTTFAQLLNTSSWITIDTEFVREKTYYPELCLIQIGNAEHSAVIDTQAFDDLSGLENLLFNPNIIKVVHAASQDMEIFYYRFKRMPAPMFDTQQAAALLGFGEQIGYANLVEKLLGVIVDKSQTRTDWSKRPLSEAQIEYAADDVRYLAQIYPMLIADLEKRGRHAWLHEDFAALSDIQRYEVHPENLWQRIKQVNRLRGVEINALKYLAAWRENIAQQENKPRKWLISDEVLLDIARIKPRTVADFARLRGLEPSKLQRYGDTLLNLVTQALAEPKEVWPQLEKSPQASVAQEAIADALMAIVRMLAAEHDIAPGALASRNDLLQLAMGARDVALLTGWPRHVAGDAALKFLNGDSDLKIENNTLKLL
ncbi:MAG: ribonuclease D [Gammaproteobacteria bacterium]|nr:ribonuclease D [Gammaproteobacteria bacterium]